MTGYAARHEFGTSPLISQEYGKCWPSHVWLHLQISTKKEKPNTTSYSRSSSPHRYSKFYWITDASNFTSLTILTRFSIQCRRFYFEIVNLNHNFWWFNVYSLTSSSLQLPFCSLFKFLLLVNVLQAPPENFQLAVITFCFFSTEASKSNYFRITLLYKTMLSSYGPRNETRCCRPVNGLLRMRRDLPHRQYQLCFLWLRPISSLHGFTCMHNEKWKALFPLSDDERMLACRWCFYFDSRGSKSFIEISCTMSFQTEPLLKDLPWLL